MLLVGKLMVSHRIEANIHRTNRLSKRFGLQNLAENMEILGRCLRKPKEWPRSVEILTSTLGTGFR